MSSVRSGAKIWRSAPGLAFGRGGSRGAAATSKTHGFLQGISWDRPNQQTTNWSFQWQTIATLSNTIVSPFSMFFSTLGLGAYPCWWNPIALLMDLSSCRWWHAIQKVCLGSSEDVPWWEPKTAQNEEHFVRIKNSGHNLSFTNSFWEITCQLLLKDLSSIVSSWRLFSQGWKDLSFHLWWHNPIQAGSDNIWSKWRLGLWSRWNMCETVWICMAQNWNRCLGRHGSGPSVVEKRHIFTPHRLLRPFLGGASLPIHARLPKTQCCLGRAWDSQMCCQRILCSLCCMKIRLIDGSEIDIKTTWGPGMVLKPCK